MQKGQGSIHRRLVNQNFFLSYILVYINYHKLSLLDLSAICRPDDYNSNWMFGILIIGTSSL